MTILDSHFLHDVDESWTLFLDRDGVINERIVDDYVRNLNQFHFLEGALEAFYNLRDIFLHTIVVTNQQGVGKELMTHEDLAEIHGHLVKSVYGVQGQIDQIYYAPQLKYLDSNMRKPEIGMGLQAKKDYPYIDFSKAIMVGDSDSDLQFGLKLGMKTVYINNPADNRPVNEYHLACDSLFSFSRLVQQAVLNKTTR